MSHADRTHEPDPEFLAHMDWLVRTARRREERFAQPVAPPRRRSAFARLRIAALVALSLVSGAAAGVSAERLQDDPLAAVVRRRSLLRLSTSESEVEAARIEHERLVSLQSKGVVSSAEVAAAAGRLADLERKLERASIDSEEVHATGREPDDALTAPRVDDRDFVRERLLLELLGLHERAERADDEVGRLAKLAEARYIAESEVELARRDRRTHVLALREVEAKVAIRAGFLDGTVPFERVDGLVRVAELEHALERQRLATEQLEGELRAVALEVLVRRPEVGGDSALAGTWFERARREPELRRELRRDSTGLDHAWRALEASERELALTATELEIVRERLYEGLTEDQREALESLGK